MLKKKVIYAATKPIEEYNVFYDGEVVGLYEYYSHEPALFALIMIGTAIPYDYEENRPDSDKQVSIGRIDILSDTLEMEVEGQTVEDMLLTMNPVEFYEAIEYEDLEDWPIVKEVYQGDPEVFKAVVGSRAGAWATGYRGVVESTGKVTSVCFGGISAIDCPKKLATLNAVTKKNYEASWKRG